MDEQKRLKRSELLRHIGLALEIEDDAEFRRAVSLLYSSQTKPRPKFVSSRPLFKVNQANTEIVVELSRADAKRVEEIFYDFIARKGFDGKWRPASLKPRRITPALFSFTFLREITPVSNGTAAKSEKRGRREKPAPKPEVLAHRFESLDEEAQREFLRKMAAKHGISL